MVGVYEIGDDLMNLLTGRIVIASTLYDNPTMLHALSYFEPLFTNKLNGNDYTVYIFEKYAFMIGPKVHKKFIGTELNERIFLKNVETVFKDIPENKITERREMLFFNFNDLFISQTMFLRKAGLKELKNTYDLNKIYD